MPLVKLDPRALQARPLIITLPRLRAVLLPKIGGWKWAEDALVDLWRLGAPSPDSGPCHCKDPRTCTHVKRILMPRQFEVWWADVCQRTGRDPSKRPVIKS